MSRNHRPDYPGVHQVVSTSKRMYGKCYQCNKMKPIYWVSHTWGICKACMKANEVKPFYPPISIKCDTTPPAGKRRGRKVRSLYKI